MKKTFTTILIVASLVLILDSMNAGQAIAMFLLAGVVPGTSFIMSADQMLGLFAGLLGFVIARVTTWAVQTYSYSRSADAKTA